MYPNPPTPPPYQPAPPSAPLDYLNQIAPSPQKPSLFASGPRKLFLILGIAVVLVILAVVIVNVITGSSRNASEQLAARLASTATIATEAQSQLKNSQLRSLNSDLRVFFTNTNRELKEPFSEVGIDTTKLSGGVTKDETASTEAINARLEDARLNVRYDETYAREMAYQVSTILALMQQVYQSTPSQALKDAVEKAYNDLEPLQQRFYDFNDAKS